MKTKLHFGWLVSGALFLIASVIFFLLSVTVFDNYKTVHKPLSSTTNAYLSFNTNYASPDSNLTVSIHGLAPEYDSVVYTWSVGNEIVMNNHTDTYIPTDNDLEKFITVEVSYDLDNKLVASLYCSKLPVIYLNTSGNQAVNEEYTSVSVAMQGSSQYPDNSLLYYGNALIKLRGNSSKNRPKKPYKIKLDDSCDLFGMGDNRQWTLIANDIDHTLIRNQLVYKLSADMGMPYAADSVQVILILNNEYQGVYQLCEQVKIDENRIDIFDWEELAKEGAKLITTLKKQTLALDNATADIIYNDIVTALKTDLSWITSPYTFHYNNEVYTMTDYIDIPSTTGGFLLEMDFYHLYQPAVSQITTNYSQPFYFSSPEYASSNKALYSYADKYIQAFEYALHSEDFTYHNDADHYIGVGNYYDWNSGWVSSQYDSAFSAPQYDNYHYTRFIDMDSLVNNWLICEFTVNWDSMKNSVFISKDIGHVANICPVWDFDWAFGNTNMYNIDTWFPTGWQTTNDYFTMEQYYQSEQWNRYLIKDPYFLLMAYEKYHEIRPTLLEDIVKEGGELDSYYELLNEAGNANDNKWGYTYGEYNSVGYDASMDNLREFINLRLQWLDNQFADFDTLVKSINSYIPSDEIFISTYIFNADGTITITANVSDENASKIRFTLNGTNVYTADVSDGTATITTSKLFGNSRNIVVCTGIDNDNTPITSLTNYKVFGGSYYE